LINPSLIEKIKPYYEAQDSGHDWAHIKRVVAMATLLAQNEKADLTVVIPAAYLHDIVNVPKNHPERERASELAADKAIKLLTEINYDETKLQAIRLAIIEHSFSRNLTPSTIESACVQDADRLDAIGAIGILRCAAVNVQMKGSFYHADDPFAHHRELDDKQFMIDHYYTKLFKLTETLQTETAKIEGKKRVAFMKEFLKQLEFEILDSESLKM